jgi:F-box and WD-40 domain protein CDC4
MINVYSPLTGDIILTLKGHQGGVWALATSGDTLVSSSTDQMIRIWNLVTGRCTHVFGGHTATVRCVTIVKPECIDIVGENGAISTQKLSNRTLIVTGGRDKSLMVWDLPRGEDAEFVYDVSCTSFH